MSNEVPEYLDQKVENKVNFIFSLITFLLVILLAFFTRYIQQAETITENDRLSYIQLDYTDKLTINLLNLETQAQGFLLTQDNYFSLPFEQSIEKITKVMSKLERRWSSYIDLNEISSLEHDIELVIIHLTELTDAENVYTNSQLERYQAVKAEIASIKENIYTIRSRIRQAIRQDHETNVNALDTLRWAMFGLAIISFALLFITFKQTRQQQISAKKYTEEISRRNNNLETTVNNRTEELIDLASHITTSSENEKKRIARELHDELGALLTAARMDTSWIKRTLKPADDDPIKIRLERLLESIDSSIHVKREITNSLVPPLLRELGLVEAIEAMTEDAPEDKPINYALELTSELPQISGDQELALYRICQESLTNIRKYANANKVTITLNVVGSNIELYIIDDGIGFDEDKLKKGTHGITGMRARAAMFGGVMTVSSPQHEGTVVKTVLPIEAESGQA
jgi:signal transduction histidine kinase